MNKPAWESFAAALFWTLPFIAGGRLRLGASASRRSWLSLAAGISIAYVFVDLLPQMNRMQQTFSAAATTRSLLLPEYRVYASALAGFVVFYVMETMVAQSRPQRKQMAEGKSSLVYRLDVGGFAGYCALMSYLLISDARRSLISLTLYSVAMFFHFWVVDHSLRTEHAGIYDRFGSWVIAAAIPVGWMLGILNLSSEFLVPTLLGFIGGGVVINSIRDELPGKGEGRAAPFVFGALGYAALTTMIELSEKHAHAGVTPYQQ